MLKLPILKCLFFFDSWEVNYDLKKIGKDGGFDMQGKQGNLVFNFCKTLEKPSRCTNNPPLSRGYYIDTRGICSTILPPDNTDVEMKVNNPELPLEGFQLKYKDSPFGFSLHCSKEGKHAFKVSGPIIHILSPSACGNHNQFIKIASQYKYIISIVLLCVGLMLTFFGSVHWKQTISVIGFVLAAGTFYAFCFTSIQYNKNNKNNGVVLVLSVIIGCIMSYFSVAFIKVFHFLCGFCAGASLGYLGMLVIFKTATGVTLAGVCLGLGGWLGIICMHTSGISIMMITSIFGAYLSVESFGLLAGWTESYFSTFTTLSKSPEGPLYYYGAIALTLVLIAAGFGCQKTQLKDSFK